MLRNSRCNDWRKFHNQENRFVTATLLYIFQKIVHIAILQLTNDAFNIEDASIREEVLKSKNRKAQAATHISK